MNNCTFLIVFNYLIFVFDRSIMILIKNKFYYKYFTIRLKCINNIVITANAICDFPKFLSLIIKNSNLIKYQIVSI